MEAYCVKCKAKREIQDPTPAFNRVGSPVTRGTCPECGTKLFRTGRTPAHTGLTPAEHQVQPRSGKLVIVEFPRQSPDGWPVSGQGIYRPGLGWPRAGSASLGTFCGCGTRVSPKVSRAE